MGSETNKQANQFGAVMVAAFPHFVGSRLEMLGLINVGPLSAAVERGRSRLAKALAEMLVAPASQQATSPLELVRDATLPISTFLSDLGVRSPVRDDWQRAAHPEDRFALYPASSRDLGEEAWRLHLQWGVDKAAAVAGVVPSQGAMRAPQLPAVALFGVAVEDRGDLVEAVSEWGYQPLVWRNPAAVAAGPARGIAMVIVDVRHPRAHDTIRALADAGVRNVATGDQIDDLAMPGLLALGAEEVVDLGRLVARLGVLLPRLV